MRHLGSLLLTSSLQPFVELWHQIILLAVMLILLVGCHAEVIKAGDGNIVFPAPVFVDLLQQIMHFLEVLLCLEFNTDLVFILLVKDKLFVWLVLNQTGELVEIEASDYLFVLAF